LSVTEALTVGIKYSVRDLIYEWRRQYCIRSCYVCTI